jgi:phosphoglycolate phosphatase-like HAD superfamily hydrolase
MRRFSLLLVAALACAHAPPPIQATTTAAPVSDDELGTWRDGAAKRAVIDFVARVTKKGGPDFVPPDERIAVFDNDGTLWSEKPLPFELAFALDRVKALAPSHPEWRTQEPFASVLSGDMRGVMRSGERGAMQIIAATHTGITTDELTERVEAWLATARHPDTGLPYTSMIYAPMVELLAYLRAHGFETFIVSGGGVGFMRPWTQRVYGIPPERVIGSAMKLALETRDGKPVLVNTANLDFIDDKAGKPAGIQSRIGRRPIAAFGNSDGDKEMLEWTMAGSGARFAMLVHHDDAAREYAYDRSDPLQRLDKAWDEAAAKGWTVVSMKNDWVRVR